MKQSAHARIGAAERDMLYLTVSMYGLIILLAWLDEILDLPWLLLGAPPTPVNWRESILETIIVAVVGVISTTLLRRLGRGRNRAEEALRESQERFSLLVEGVKDYAIFLLDPRGRITSWNAGAERIKGYRAEEIIGQHFSCFYPPPEAQLGRPEQELRMAAAEGRFEDEGWRVRKDGSRFWADVVITALRDPSEQLVGFAKITRDLTQRKQAEEELRRVNRALRTLSECNQALVRAAVECELPREICRIIVETGGYRLAWVGFAEQNAAKGVRPVAQAGYEEGYLATVNITWADTERGRGPTGTAIRTGQPCIARNILTDPNFAPWRQEATERGYASAIALPLVADTTPFGALNIYATEPDAFDAEEVKLLTELANDLAYGIQVLRMRAERLRAEEALRKSEASLAEAQRSAHLGNWEWDIARDEAWWSAEMYRIFGFSPQAFVPTLQSSLSCMHPADREFVRKSVDEALHHGKAYDIDYRIVRADGVERVVQAQGQVFFDETGRAVRMVGTVQDITERARAEEEIRRLNEELEARVRARTAELEDANKELEGFTYSVSHDLRAPLRHIDGFSKLLLEEYQAELPQQAQHYLTRIRAATLGMAQLVDDLLNLSRLGRKELARRPTRLDTLVEEVLADLKGETRGRSIAWRIHPLPTVECDPGLVKQVFANLLGNALKFTRRRAPAVIEVGAMTPEDQPVIFVRDNGVGFNMKYADRLFGIFQRLHRQEEFEGTGVGLATVERIIHKHGGRVWAEAEPDQGATFWFSLGAPPSRGVENT